MKNKEALNEMQNAYNAVTRPKTEEQLNEDKKAAEKKFLASAIKYVEAAIGELAEADALVKTGDYAYWKDVLEELLESDRGQAGMKVLLKKM